MSEKIDLLATALSKAQSEITGAMRNKENPFYKSSYADLDSVWNAIRGPLGKYGLSLIQGVNENNNLETILTHSSGQWIETSCIKLNPVKADPQGTKSAMTLLERACIGAAMGCPDFDDDGNAASQKDMPQAKVKEEVKDFKVAEIKKTKCPVDGNQKFTSGTNTGKTLWDVLKEDSCNDYAYAWARKQDIDNGVDLPKAGKDYVLLCEFEQVF